MFIGATKRHISLRVQDEFHIFKSLIICSTLFYLKDSGMHFYEFSEFGGK